MPAVTAAAFLTLWLVAAGLLAVSFEVKSVNAGLRVRQLEEREAVLLEELRRWEMRYNELRSPDVLESNLPEEFREWAYPLPREADPPSRPSDRG